MGKTMTQGQWTPLAPPPGPTQPLYYTPPNMLPPQKPSGTYKAIGIVWIVLGIMGVLYALFSIVTTGFSSSFMSRMYDSATLAYLVAHGCVSVVTGSLLIATGVGIVRAKRWARVVGVVYAIASTLSALVGTAMQILVIQPKVTGSMGGPASGFMRDLGPIFLVTAILGLLVALVVPAVTLVAVLRRAAKDELDQ
jgi:hypothetical protein